MEGQQKQHQQNKLSIKTNQNSRKEEVKVTTAGGSPLKNKRRAHSVELDKESSSSGHVGESYDEEDYGDYDSEADDTI